MHLPGIPESAINHVMETPVKEKDMVSGQFVHHCLIIVIV
jgi:hypothetical protein